MADFTFDHIFVDPPTGLVAIPSVGGIELRWDAQNNNNIFATEIWMSASNDITATALYKTVKDNTAWVALDSSITRYFWARHIDKASQTNSGFFPATPAGATGTGVSGTTPSTKLDDIDFNNPDLDFDVECDSFNLTANSFNVTTATAGSTGAVTINALSGRVKFASGATSLVVTNAKVTTDSHVLAIPSQSDTTGRVTAVVPGSGSFTIYCVAPTSTMSVDFFILNG